MIKLINKDTLVAEIERRRNYYKRNPLLINAEYCIDEDNAILNFLDTLEVKEVDLMIHIIIAECCDWLGKNTNLSHNKIEQCRNLMLTVKDSQLKVQKGD